MPAQLELAPELGLGARSAEAHFAHKRAVWICCFSDVSVQRCLLLVEETEFNSVFVVVFGGVRDLKDYQYQIYGLYQTEAQAG